jgi:hypothetical protein
LNRGSELNFSSTIQGDLTAKEWKEFSPDSVMADFIHLDATVDADTAEANAMAIWQ